MVIRLVLVALAGGLLGACSYSPKFEGGDCRVKCSDKGTCPEALQCKNGWCRPKESTGSCDCEPGDQRACGGGMGTCNAGVQTCTNNRSWGACVGEGKPTSEVCDNKDNDCNGAIDDSIPDAPACPLSKGECMMARQKCVSGAYSGVCDATDYGPTYELVETKCDGLDNDCDGFSDSKPIVQLAQSMSEFVFAEYDGGFSLVGLEEPAAGGYQVVVQRLTADLQKRGSTDLISPPAVVGVTTQYTLAARVNPIGTTFVAWAERLPDAGVNLSSVEATGIVSTFPTYADADRGADIRLSLGVSPTKVFVTWPGHPVPNGTDTFNNTARLVTWDLVDGGVAKRDFLTFADGGFNSGVDVCCARVSPTGRVMGIRSDLTTTTVFPDGGTETESSSSSLTLETAGPRTSTAGLGGRFQYVEVGPVTSSGWQYFNAGFNFFPFNFPDESGFEFRNDVFSTAATSSLKKQDNDKITVGNIGRGNNSVLISWTEEYKTAIIGTPFGNGAQARLRTLGAPPNNSFFGDLQLGHPGGGSMVGVAWRDTKTGPGAIYGQMVCQP